MSKIIRIDASNTDLGKIFADIDESTSKEVRIIYDKGINTLFSSNDIKLIENYAERTGKTVKFISSAQIEKSGFVIGADINQDPNPPRSQTSGRRIKVPNLSMSRPKFKFNAFPLVILIILVLLLGGGFYFFNLKYPKAQVLVDIKSQVFTGTQEATISKSADEVDTENNIIPGTLASVQVDQEIIVIPTGEKEIGEKAQGEIKLFNKTDKDITLDKGSEIVIKTDGDKEFSFFTKEEVKIDKKTPGESVTDGSGEEKKADVYGTKKVKIEAMVVGNDYNIDNDSIKDVKIVDYNDDKLSAEIENEPDGGESKKATVVLQKDLDDLEEKLVEKAEKKAGEKLLSEVEDGVEVLPDALSTRIVTLTFDKKADEEADKIIGNITLEASTLTFKTEDVRTVLAEKVAGLVPGNFSVVEGKDNLIVTSTTKELLTDEAGLFTGILISNKVQSSVAPNLEASEIAENVQKKRVEDAQAYLSEVANIVGAKITINPNIPIYNKRLPSKDKIVVTINVVEEGNE